MRIGPVAVLAAVLGLAGCSSPSPSPSPSPTGPPASSAVATPSDRVVAPVTAPTPLPGEIARGTVTPSLVDEGTGRLPARGSLYLHAACAGPAGRTMRVRLLGPDGDAFGLSEDVVCDGSVGVAGSAATQRPSRVQVAVEGDEGVSGYAVLTTSAEG